MTRSLGKFRVFGSGATTLTRRLFLVLIALGLLVNAVFTTNPAAAANPAAALSGGVLAWGDNRSDQLGLAASGAQ